MPGVLRRSQLPVDTVELAEFLIGKLLCSRRDAGVTSGRIVETEAYLPDDASSHAFRGRTARNSAMFLARGFAYVYFIYGTAHCINVVGDRRGVGAAVLIRALEPLVGIELMAQRRGERSPGELARGPGRLAQALGIDRTDDGQDLCARGPVWLADDGCSPTRIGVGVRIGLTKERDRPLRFFVPGSRFVSGPRALSR